MSWQDTAVPYFTEKRGLYNIYRWYRLSCSVHCIGYGVIGHCDMTVMCQAMLTIKLMVYLEGLKYFKSMCCLILVRDYFGK